MKTCLCANFKFIDAMVSEFQKEDEEEQGQPVKIMFACILFSFLQTVTFSHVLHRNVLGRQIELKMEVKLNYLMFGCPPIAIPIIHSTTLLWDIM